MADVDRLARQLTAMVTNLARRGRVLAGGMALVVFLVGGLSYLTGLAGLDGSASQAWTVIGAAMLIVAVGAPLLAWWRLSRVSKDAAALVTEGLLETRSAGPPAIAPETPGGNGNAGRKHPD